MASPNNELLERLHGAIAGWTDEVGAAQQQLSLQIDGANSQLGQLLRVLQEKNGHALTLAGANSEIERLKQALLQSGQSPESTEPHGAQSIEALRNEFGTTLERLHTAIQAWTTEVSQSQSGLVSQFDTANTHLHRLLDILGEASEGSSGHGPASGIESIAQLRHERDILAAEVHTLNIEVETLRNEQEDFASANLNAETERDSKQQLALDDLQIALSERDEIIDECQALLEESQRIEETLTGEISVLEQRVAVLTETETQLKESLAQQRQESDKQIQALSGLTQEMEGIRQALGAESHRDGAIPNAADTDSSSALQLRIDELEAEVATLLDRPDRSALEAAEGRIAELERALSESPSTADADVDLMTAPQTETDSGQDEALEAVQTALRTANETIARLEADRDSREGTPAPAADDGVSKADHEAIVAGLHEELSDLESRPTQDALEAAQQQIEALKSKLEAASTNGQDSVMAAPEVQDALENSLADLEAELATLKQREHSNVETARTLLKELETHRTFEMAQATSMADLRAEAETLRNELAEKIDAIRALEESHATALAEARQSTEALQGSLEDAQAQLTAANDAMAASQERITSLEESASDEEKNLAQRQQEIVERHAAELQTLRESQSAAEKRLAETEDQLTASVARVVELEASQSDLQTRFDALADENEALRSQIEDRGRDLEATRNEVTAGEETLRGLNASIETLQAQISEATTLQELFEEESAATEITLAEQQATQEKLTAEVSRLEEALAEKSAALEAGDANQITAADSVDALETAQDALTKEVARLEAELTAKISALEASELAMATRDATVEELEMTQQELSAEIDRLNEALAAARADLGAREVALDEASAKSAAQEADLAEVTSTLESQQALLQERDAQIDSFRTEVAVMGDRLQTLVDEERESKQQAETLKGELEEMRASDALHVDDLEKTRIRLERMRQEYEAQEGAFHDLSARGLELEQRLTNARREELSALTTVEALEGEVVTLQEKEALESKALDETRKMVATHQEALLEREDRVSKLEAQLASVLGEKDALRAQTEAQVAEMQATVAQVSDAITERDELRDAISNSAVVSTGVSVGEAGLSTTLAEALAARDQHTRQQDILLSELTRSDGNRSLGDILVDAEVLTRKQLNQALEIQAEDPTQLLGTVLIEHEFATDDAIAQAVACQLDKSVVNPMEVHIQPQAIKLLNGDICTWHVCIPLRVTGDRLVVAMANPLDESAIFKLRDISQREITPVVGAASQIMDAIDAHYGTF